MKPGKCCCTLQGGVVSIVSADFKQLAPSLQDLRQQEN